MRRRVLASLGKHLPYDAEVEWLKSSGTQWIDTGIASQNNLVHEFRFDETESNNQRMVFGFKEGNNWYSPGMNDAHWGGSWFYVDFAGGETRIYNFYYPNRNGIYKFAFIDGNAYFNFNGVTKWTSSAVGTYDGTARSLVFAVCRNGVPSLNAIGRMLWYRLSKSGIMLRDFIPVRFTNERGETEGAMYDRVSGQLFRNAGTGAFVIGPDKVSTEVVVGGGTKCLTPRRLYRRSSRPSARFCAHTSAWEVAA